MTVAAVGLAVRQDSIRTLKTRVGVSVLGKGTSFLIFV